MRVFVEYNEPTGPISGFGLGDGTPGGSYYRKTCFFDFFVVRSVHLRLNLASVTRWCVPLRVLIRSITLLVVQPPPDVS